MDNNQSDDFDLMDQDQIDGELIEVLDDSCKDDTNDEDEEIEMEEDIVEVREVDIPDMSLYTFNLHSDSVYCVALHPTDHHLFASGNVESMKLFILNSYLSLS
jgi:hypothetical protein